MKKVKKIHLKKQPDETSCGPTCLHAIYKFWNHTVDLEDLISEISQFDDEGGTLAVILGVDALKRGYKVLLHSLNLNVFDPTWFKLKPENLITKLSARLKEKKISKKERIAIKSYIEFLQLGGTLKFGDITPKLIRKYLSKNIPLLVGLSSTWLYQCEREDPLTNQYNDVSGDPAGHFVLACQYFKNEMTIEIADPYIPNPISSNHHYLVHISRFISALYLGVFTYDANILIIEKA